MNRDQLLRRIARRWDDFQASYAGLSDAEMVTPGVAGDWSVKDVLAHVAIWEGESLRHLPAVAEGLRPPRYGGIDAFNEREVAATRHLTLAEVRYGLGRIHDQLLRYLSGVPKSLFATETRFRHRLRLDTYGHYPLHEKGIVAWRSGRRR